MPCSNRVACLSARRTASASWHLPTSSNSMPGSGRQARWRRSKNGLSQNAGPVTVVIHVSGTASKSGYRDEIGAQQQAAVDSILSIRASLGITEISWESHTSFSFRWGHRSERWGIRQSGRTVSRSKMEENPWGIRRPSSQRIALRRREFFSPGAGNVAVGLTHRAGAACPGSNIAPPIR